MQFQTFLMEHIWVFYWDLLVGENMPKVVFSTGSSLFVNFQSKLFLNNDLFKHVVDSNITITHKYVCVTFSHPVPKFATKYLRCDAWPY